MRKEFRLEKLLAIRIMEERSAAARLSEIDAQLNQAQDNIRQLQKKQSQLYAEFVTSIQTPGNLAPLQAHLSALKEETLELGKRVEKIKNEKAGVYNTYVDALKKRKILENLKDKTLN